MPGPIRLLALMAGLSLPLIADAAVILQDAANQAIQVDFFEPVAQSFTAADRSIRFAFYFEAINPPAANDALEISLLGGDGLGGPLLASTTFVLTDGFVGFRDIDFASASLTVGQRYTAVLVQPGTSPRWGVDLQTLTDPYGGGRAYFKSDPGIFVNSPGDDLRFRVTPVAVQEPTAPMLVGLGLLGLFGVRRWVTPRSSVAVSSG